MKCEYVFEYGKGSNTLSPREIWIKNILQNSQIKNMSEKTYIKRQKLRFVLNNIIPLPSYVHVSTHP